MRKWVLLGVILVSFLWGSSGEAATTQLVIDDQQVSYSLDLIEEDETLQPGKALPHQKLVISNETKETSHILMMRRDKSNDWVMDYLQGTVDFGEDTYTIADIMSGVKVNIWPGSKKTLTLNLRLADGKISQKQQKAADFKLTFYIFVEGKEPTAVSSEALTAKEAKAKETRKWEEKRDNLSKQNTRRGQVVTLGGCVLIAGGVLLLGFKRKLH